MAIRTLVRAGETMQLPYVRPLPGIGLPMHVALSFIEKLTKVKPMP